jgi:hypothetical protein
MCRRRNENGHFFFFGFGFKKITQKELDLQASKNSKK